MKRIVLIIITLLTVLSTTVCFAIDDELSEPVEKNILFIGNSKTYYNNMPRFFYNLVTKSPMNIKLNYYAITWEAGGIAANHLPNIKNVIENDGNVTGTIPKFYRDNLYKDGNRIHFDYIVLQLGNVISSSTFEYNADADLRMRAATVETVKLLSSKDTVVVINSIYFRWLDGSDSFSIKRNKLKQWQEIIDESSLNIKKAILLDPNTKYKEVKVSPTGWAFVNYMFDHTTSKYFLNNGKYVSDIAYNDLFIGDGQTKHNHPTRVGTYLIASTLYSTIFNESPEGIEFYGKIGAALTAVNSEGTALIEGYNKENEKLNQTVVTAMQKLGAKTALENYNIPDRLKDRNYLRGDLDDSKKIDIIDVRLLLQKYISSDSNKEYSLDERIIMDMDLNGTIDITDVRLLLQKYINN